MTRDKFIKKWLGNPDYKYCEENRDAMRDDIDLVIDYAIKNHGDIHHVSVPKGTFNCIGGNHAKGIKTCEEWCGEDICQKPSN